MLSKNFVDLICHKNVPEGIAEGLFSLTAVDKNEPALYPMDALEERPPNHEVDYCMTCEYVNKIVLQVLKTCFDWISEQNRPEILSMPYSYVADISFETKWRNVNVRFLRNIDGMGAPLGMVLHDKHQKERNQRNGNPEFYLLIEEIEIFVACFEHGLARNITHREFLKNGIMNACRELNILPSNLAQNIALKRICIHELGHTLSLLSIEAKIKAYETEGFEKRALGAEILCESEAENHVLSTSPLLCFAYSLLNLPSESELVSFFGRSFLDYEHCLTFYLYGHAAFNVLLGNNAIEAGDIIDKMIADSESRKNLEKRLDDYIRKTHNQLLQEIEAIGVERIRDILIEAYDYEIPGLDSVLQTFQN